MHLINVFLLIRCKVILFTPFPGNIQNSSNTFTVVVKQTLQQDKSKFLTKAIKSRLKEHTIFSNKHIVFNNIAKHFLELQFLFSIAHHKDSKISFNMQFYRKKDMINHTNQRTVLIVIIMNEAIHMIKEVHDQKYMNIEKYISNMPKNSL